MVVFTEMTSSNKICRITHIKSYSAYFDGTAKHIVLKIILNINMTVSLIVPVGNFSKTNNHFLKSFHKKMTLAP